MNDYVVIDAETSGINPDEDEIICLSALKIVNGMEAGRFSELVKPSRPLTEEVEILTGITNADVCGKYLINDLLPDFLNFIGDNPLVAHNVGFDIKFINAALKKAGMPPLGNKTVDTSELAKKKCRTDNFTLHSVAKFLGVDYYRLTDDRIVFEVYRRLNGMKDLPRPETVGDKVYRDGRIFLKRIGKCEVRQKGEDNSYLLKCGIFGYGTERFRYVVGSPFMESHNGVLWLEKSAFETVKNAIEKYENEREEVRNKHKALRSATWEEYGITIYYEYSAPDEMLFNVYVEAKGVEFKMVERVRPETIFAMVKELSDDENAIPKCGEIENSPLYRSALKYGDNRLIAELNFIYGAPNKENLSVFEGVDGIKRLPKLPEEYDRCYVVDYDVKAVTTLKISGYDFVRTPDFAMKGLTHSKLLINPHKKYAVDAAKTDAPPITFGEFLKLFEWGKR